MLRDRSRRVLDKPTDADWILKTMVAVAATDGRLDEAGLTSFDCRRCV